MTSSFEQDHYAILAILVTHDIKSVTSADIKKSFRRRALLYHPDKGHPHGEAIFKLINHAQDTLLDPVKKDQYDLWYKGFFGRSNVSQAIIDKESRRLDNLGGDELRKQKEDQTKGKMEAQARERAAKQKRARAEHEKKERLRRAREEQERKEKERKEKEKERLRKRKEKEAKEKEAKEERLEKKRQEVEQREREVFEKRRAEERARADAALRKDPEKAKSRQEKLRRMKEESEKIRRARESEERRKPVSEPHTEPHTVPHTFPESKPKPRSPAPSENKIPLQEPRLSKGEYFEKVRNLQSQSNSVHAIRESKEGGAEELHKKAEITQRSAEAALKRAQQKYQEAMQRANNQIEKAQRLRNESDKAHEELVNLLNELDALNDLYLEDYGEVPGQTPKEKPKAMPKKLTPRKSSERTRSTPISAYEAVNSDPPKWSFGDQSETGFASTAEPHSWNPSSTEPPKWSFGQNWTKTANNFTTHAQTEEQSHSSTASADPPMRAEAWTFETAKSVFSFSFPQSDHKSSNTAFTIPTLSENAKPLFGFHEDSTRAKAKSTGMRPTFTQMPRVPRHKPQSHSSTSNTFRFGFSDPVSFKFTAHSTL